MPFTILPFYGQNPLLVNTATPKSRNEIFRHDLEIFFLPKSAAVLLFHQYKIKLIIWSARKQY